MGIVSRSSRAICVKGEKHGSQDDKGKGQDTAKGKGGEKGKGNLKGKVKKKHKEEQERENSMIDEHPATKRVKTSKTDEASGPPKEESKSQEATVEPKPLGNADFRKFLLS